MVPKTTGRNIFWAALAVIVLLLNGPALISRMRPEPSEGMDFFAEWSSARNWREGLPIYMDLDLAAERYVGRRRQPGERFPFPKGGHPPVAVLLALPFVALSYPAAMLAWNLLSLIALVVSLWLIVRALRIRVELWMISPLVVVALLCYPLLQQVKQGQLNLVLLVLIVGAWAADRESHQRLAGVLLGIAAAVKLFPTFLLLHYALRRRWKVLGWGVTGIGASMLLSAGALGVDAQTTYWHDVMPSLSGYRSLWGNASLQGFWTKWFDAGAWNPFPMPGVPDIPPLIARSAIADLGLLISALLVLWAWGRACLRLPSDFAFALTLTTMLLLSPLTWDHSFLLLLLPVILLWRTLGEARSVRALALVAATLPLALPPTIFATALAGPHRFVSLVGVSVQFFALTGLFVLQLMSPSSATNRH